MIKKIKNPLIEKSRFLITPEPFEDEIFTSWLVRCAYAHNTHPHTFMNLHFPTINNVYTFNVNFDATVGDDMLRTLVWKTGFSFNKLYQLTLKSYSGYLQESIINNGTNKFLSSFRFCPQCFKEDRVPYIRKEWKVVFSTFCKKHKCYLHEKCPCCNMFIDSLKMYKNDFKYNYCYKCGYDLSKIKVEAIKSGYLYRSNKYLLNVFNNGYIELNKVPIYSFSFFDVIAHLCKIVIVKKIAFGSKDIMIFLNKLHNQNFSSAQTVFSQLYIKEQFILFGMIMSLFNIYPNSLKKIIIDNHLSHFDLTKDMKSIPFWYEDIVNEVAPKIVYCGRMLTEKEIISAIEFLKRKNIIVNQSNLTNIIGCNFFSSYNKLRVLMQRFS